MCDTCVPLYVYIYDTQEATYVLTYTAVSMIHEYMIHMQLHISLHIYIYYNYPATYITNYTYIYLCYMKSSGTKTNNRHLGQSEAMITM